MDTPLTPRLLASLYQGALDAAHWPGALQQLCAAYGARGCGLGNADLVTTAADFGTSSGQLAGTHGYEASAIASYISYYSERDVWRARTTTLQAGEATTGSALLPDAQLVQTEWYNDWLRQQDLFHVMGGCVQRQGRTTTLVSFLRGRGAGDFSVDEVQQLRRLIPHLQQAGRLHRRLGEQQQLQDGALAALEQLHEGVLLFARDGRLLHATLRAQHMLATVPGLRLGAGRLDFIGGGVALGTLQALLRDALASGNGHGVQPGGQVTLETAGGALHCQVTPLPPDSGGLAALAGAALFCSQPAERGSLAATLRARSGMTGAEAQLTEALAKGMTLKEFARQREVSFNTVRSQLQRASAKAGVRRQAELVRLALLS